MDTQFGGHHIFCNGDPRSPVEGCLWCDPNKNGGCDLWTEFPYKEGDDIEALVKEKFPDVIIRK
jgi:hypothetical protein